MPKSGVAILDGITTLDGVMTINGIEMLGANVKACVGDASAEQAA